MPLTGRVCGQAGPGRASAFGRRAGCSDLAGGTNWRPILLSGRQDRAPVPDSRRCGRRCITHRGEWCRTKRPVVTSAACRGIRAGWCGLRVAGHPSPVSSRSVRGNGDRCGVGMSRDIPHRSARGVCCRKRRSHGAFPATKRREAVGVRGGWGEGTRRRRRLGAGPLFAAFRRSVIRRSRGWRSQRRRPDLGLRDDRTSRTSGGSLGSLRMP